MEEGDIFLAGPSGERVRLRDELARNYDAVFRFLRKLSGDEETARDLAQDVALKAILSARRYRGESSFRTWLLAIAANLYRDALRKKKPLALGDEDLIHDGAEAAERTERRLDAERAWALLGNLPLKKRKALVLRLEFGYSYEEIAAVLSCPVGTVRSRIHQAIESLRAAMGENHG